MQGAKVAWVEQWGGRLDGKIPQGQSTAARRFSNSNNNCSVTFHCSGQSTGKSVRYSAKSPVLLGQRCIPPARRKDHARELSPGSLSNLDMSRWMLRFKTSTSEKFEVSTRLVSKLINLQTWKCRSQVKKEELVVPLAGFTQRLDNQIDKKVHGLISHIKDHKRSIGRARKSCAYSLPVL